jgi:hypothetical protein
MLRMVQGQDGGFPRPISFGFAQGATQSSRALSSDTIKSEHRRRLVRMSGPPSGWHPKRPAADEAIESLVSTVRMDFPPAYIGILRRSNGGFAELSVSPWTVDFWPAERLAELNREYDIEGMAPGFVAFGSNLGEELLAFSKAEGATSAIYMLPWHMPSGEEALKTLSSIEDLIQAIMDPGQS